MDRPPRNAFVLGASGLLPAAAAALAVGLGPVEWLRPAATIGALYEAIILSFLGGMWWGLAVRAAEPPATGLLVMSVLPSLAAWAALALLGPGPYGFAALALLFAAVLPGDARLTRLGVAPGWWAGLRVPLSLGMAALATATALVLARRLAHLV